MYTFPAATFKACNVSVRSEIEPVRALRRSTRPALISQGARLALDRHSIIGDAKMRSGLPRTMVYLSWGEQRPITLREGHSAPKLSLSIDPSALSTRSLNSGPDITASLAPDALLPFWLPAENH